MLGLVRSTRYANETASTRRQRHSREAGSCSDPILLKNSPLQCC